MTIKPTPLTEKAKASDQPIVMTPYIRAKEWGISDEILSQLLQEAIASRAKAKGAEAAYEIAAKSHFEQAFERRHGHELQQALGVIQFTDGVEHVQLIELEFNWNSTMQVVYKWKATSGKWAKTVQHRDAAYVFAHFKLVGSS